MLFSHLPYSGIMTGKISDLAKYGGMPENPTLFPGHVFYSDFPVTNTLPDKIFAV